MKKIKSLTVSDLLAYSREYGFNISPDEAKQIVSYLRTQTIDPFNSKQRKKLFKDLAAITDAQTAQKAETLFKTIIKTYGVDHMFS